MLGSCMYGAVRAASPRLGVLNFARSASMPVTADLPASSQRPSRQATPVL